MFRRFDLPDLGARLEQTKRAVNAMIDAQGSANAPGHYWADVRWWSDTLFSKEPDWLYRNFRLFVREILSGGPKRYRQMPSWWMRPMTQPYERLIQGLPASLVVSEPRFAGSKQWGVRHGRHYISRDSIRHQRDIRNLHVFGALNTTRPLNVLEIGAGFGMLAEFLLRALAPGSRYFVIDIPPLLALPATYLSILRPELAQSFYPDMRGDVVFIPNYASPDLPPLDLALNTMSMQEMSEENIETYCALIASNLRGYLYSENMRRHPHNYDLRNKVATIFGKYFAVFPDDRIYDPLEGRLHQWQSYIHLCAPTGHSFPQWQGSIIGDNYTLHLDSLAVEFHRKGLLERATAALSRRTPR